VKERLQSGVKFIVLLVALQILNMSIDIPTPLNQKATEKDYNYIDTYVEYVAEVVLKNNNAIPETKHRQQRQFQLHKHLPIICQLIKLPPTTNSFLSLHLTYPPYNSSFVPQFIKEINPPPPKPC
jgi:hypothetical protein